jgi:hypothetical protein
MRSYPLANKRCAEIRLFPSLDTIGNGTDDGRRTVLIPVLKRFEERTKWIILF